MFGNIVPFCNRTCYSTTFVEFRAISASFGVAGIARFRGRYMWGVPQFGLGQNFMISLCWQGSWGNQIVSTIIQS